MAFKKQKLLFIFTLSFLISCSSISTYQSIDSTQLQWQQFADGIDYLHGKISSPKIEFHALKIDLSSPDINIFIGSQPNTVSGFVRSNNLVAGINASPFNKDRTNVGIVISNGEIISPPVNQYDAIAFFNEENGIRAIIVNQGGVFNYHGIQNAVGGFHQILKNNQLTERSETSVARHPRTAVGLSDDGRVMYWVVIDGRRVGSIGATERETALLLNALGSYSALNLDGGGSSALALRYPNGRVKPVNRPSDPLGERRISSFIGIK